MMMPRVAACELPSTIEGETPIPDNGRSLGSKDLAAPRPGDILIVPGFRFGGRREDWFGQPCGLFEARRQRMPQTVPDSLYSFQPDPAR